ELDSVLSLLVRSDGADDNFPPFHDTGFPCKTVESMVVACLEVMAPNVECVLDITDLIDGGWTDSFEDLIEYHKDFTTFYEVFATSLNDTRSLLSLAEENKTLARLLYANVITAMETYLSDTFKKQVINREAIKRRFVQSNDAFKEKITIQDIFRRMETLSEEIVQVIDQMSFHNIQKTSALFKSVLDTEFPTGKMKDLSLAVGIRHDVIHRNGKTTMTLNWRIHRHVWSPISRSDLICYLCPLLSLLGKGGA
ncbi:hypothetical protein D1O90_005417, partial [Escherichia coli]|nr:hypothetical protein [Escherichia coli]